jgi:hypothetical protein
MATLKTYALTTVADVKESLSIPSSNHTYDNLIIRKINQATAMIENYCSRRFALTTYTDEGYNGTGTNQVVLKQRPIVGDVTLKIRDSGLNEANYETVDSELIFADANSGVLDLLFTSARLWGRFAVTYQAGYSTIPDDLAEACASLAAYLVTNADTGSVNVKSKQEGQRKVDYSQQGLGGTVNLFKQLGIDDVLAGYANNALFADK